MKYMDLLYAISSQGIEVIMDRCAPLPLLFVPEEKILIVKDEAYLQKALEMDFVDTII